MITTCHMAKRSRARKMYLPKRSHKQRKRVQRANARIDWRLDYSSLSSALYSTRIPPRIAMQMQEASKNAEHKASPFLRLLFGSSH